MVQPGQTTATPTPDPGTAGQNLAQWLADVVGGLAGLPVPRFALELVLAALVMLTGYYVAGLLIRLLGRRIARRFRRPSVSRTVLRLLRLGVFAGSGLVVLNIFGVSIGNIALSVTVFSAVLGVVLAPVVGSIISGLFLLADQPYEVGDMVELVDRGQTGFVEDITLRYTKVFTLDNTFLVVPNGTMRERDVINYSAEDTRTRLKLDVTVTYEGDLEQARRLIQEAAADCENVIRGGPDIRIGAARYPAAPTCYIDAFADHGVRLRLRYWVREPYKLLTMRSRVQEQVWTRLEDADVEIAYPHSHLMFDDTSGELNVRTANGRPAPDGDTGERNPPEGHATRRDGEGS
jgi:small-conductance mechanosensitive channel